MSEKRYTIGQVSEITGLAPHVLRYWETEFDVLRPERSSAGIRMYSREDIALIFRIQHLLHTERYTIEGARRVLSRRPGEADETLVREMQALRHFLIELLEQLRLQKPVPSE